MDFVVAGQHLTINMDNPHMVIMGFVECSDPDKDKENFTDNYQGQDLRSIYIANDEAGFFRHWRGMKKNPDGMWYWVWYQGKCICSGACDPDDCKGFKEAFKMGGSCSGKRVHF